MAPRRTDPDMDEVIGRIDPNPARRAVGVGMAGLLGVILLYLVAVAPPRDLAYLVMQIVFGLAALWLAAAMWRASATPLVLTRKELKEDGGRSLFRIDNVASVDRGFFAFKPATGFLIRLKAPDPAGRVYAPGLWWRARKRVMVGGVTSAAQAKSVADLILILMAEREGKTF